jgi:hypothetical protein
LKNKKEINHHLIIRCLDIMERKIQINKKKGSHEKQEKKMKFLAGQKCCRYA